MPDSSVVEPKKKKTKHCFIHVTHLFLSGSPYYTFFMNYSLNCKLTYLYTSFAFKQITDNTSGIFLAFRKHCQSLASYSGPHLESGDDKNFKLFYALLNYVLQTVNPKAFSFVHNSTKK